MYKIYNKKMRKVKIKIMGTSTILVLFVEVTANFAPALRSKPIT